MAATSVLSRKTGTRGNCAIHYVMYVYGVINGNIALGLSQAISQKRHRQIATINTSKTTLSKNCAKFEVHQSITSIQMNIIPK